MTQKRKERFEMMTTMVTVPSDEELVAMQAVVTCRQMQN